MGFFSALLDILNPSFLLMMSLGTIGGIIIGAMPGLTSVMGVTLLLPFTYGMEPAAGMVMLLCISFGAIYGGSITAILINTPGTPASAATAIEGRKFTAKGEGGRAVGISTFSSWIGGTISAIVLILVAPQLAKAALSFGPPEYFCLAVFGLTIIASVSGKDMLKGIIAGMLGLLLSTVGLDPMTGYSRYSFGVVNLYSGIQTVPIMIGLFAISQVFVNLKDGVAQNSVKQKIDRVIPRKSDLKQSLPVAIMCGFIGTFIGIIPAAGADIAAWVSYDMAKKRSRHPEKFGEHTDELCVEGLAAPEAGNNGDTSGALVPMLTLGVPGDATAAVLIGALTLQGLQPGPQLFTQHMDLVNHIFAGGLLANALMLVFGLLLLRVFVKVIQIKPYVLSPIIFVLCILGSYALRNNLFDVGTMLVAAVIGYFFIRLEIPIAPIVLALILGPMAESNLRRSLLMSGGSWAIFVTRPISIAFLVLAVVSLCWPMIRRAFAKKKTNK
ncbi:MAG: tripartite tricarboxylate transporter permease [Candidatus Choladocola sp.]|nr:tripartite tricarboxylate transporter permease [Candidatus Choladocola sp.]